MRTARLLSTVLAVSALVAASFAADVVGTWSGKMQIDAGKGAKTEMGAQAGSLPSLMLELKADKTYAGAQTGGPGNQKHTTEGTWKLVGNTLTLTPLKRDGQPAKGEGAKPRIYTLSKDGKSLTIDLSAQFKAVAKTSGQGAPADLKVRLVLKRTK